MTPFRVLQVSVVVILLFGSTWIVRALGVAAEPPGSSATWLNSTAAFAGVMQADNSDNGDNSGDNGGDNDADNGSSDNNGNDNGSGNGNSNNNGSDDNGNYDDDAFDYDLPPYPAAPTRPPEPECAQPGQDVTFHSFDQKVRVRVFPSTPEPLRIEILQVIDFLSAPLPPGNLVGLLAYEIRGSHCDGVALTMLPAEVNLGITYNDLEATGLDESRFVIGKLDLTTRVWEPVEKRANDAASNFVSATIIEPGFYMVWEQR